MSTLGNFVWSIADQLRGVCKPHQYGGVILPMTVLRRLDCVLEHGPVAVLRRINTILEADLAASGQAHAEDIANLLAETDNPVTALAARR